MNAYVLLVSFALVSVGCADSHAGDSTASGFTASECEGDAGVLNAELAPNLQPIANVCASRIGWLSGGARA